MDLGTAGNISAAGAAWVSAVTAEQALEASWVGAAVNLLVVIVAVGTFLSQRTLDRISRVKREVLSSVVVLQMAWDIIRYFGVVKSDFDNNIINLKSGGSFKRYSLHIGLLGKADAIQTELVKGTVSPYVSVIGHQIIILVGEFIKQVDIDQPSNVIGYERAMELMAFIESIDRNLRNLKSDISVGLRTYEKTRRNKRLLNKAVKTAPNKQLTSEMFEDIRAFNKN